MIDLFSSPNQFYIFLSLYFQETHHLLVSLYSNPMLDNNNATASTGPSSSSDAFTNSSENGVSNKRKRRPAGTPGLLLLNYPNLYTASYTCRIKFRFKLWDSIPIPFMQWELDSNTKRIKILFFFQLSGIGISRSKRLLLEKNYCIIYNMEWSFYGEYLEFLCLFW